jgi:tryptophan-rich sensory protein
VTALAHPGHPRADEPAGRQVLAILVFAGAALTAAGLGSLATSATVDSAWFDALDKPSFYPPGSAFGMVWTVLYVMIAVSGFRAWRAGAAPVALGLWGVQMVLNLGWTLVFFGLRRPGWAVAEIVVLAAAIVATMAAFRPVDRMATWLLAPYLAWVAFATALTVAIAIA